MSRDTLSNWIWLSELHSFDRVLVFGWRDPGLVHCLSAQFRTVLAISEDAEECRALLADPRTRSAANVSVIHGSPEKLPLCDQAIDCAVLNLSGGAGNGTGKGRLLAARVTESMRVMTSGGWLFATWNNPLWHNRLLSRLRPAAPGSDQSPQETPVRYSPERVFAASGLQSLRPYYLGPALDQPLYVVPARRDALLIAAPGRWKHLLVRLGLHALLFPGRLLMAQK